MKKKIIFKKLTTKSQSATKQMIPTPLLHKIKGGNSNSQEIIIDDLTAF